MRRFRGCYLAGFCIHFLLITAAAVGEVASLIANGYTNLPTSAESYGNRIVWLTALVMGRTLPGSNPLRQTVAAYMNSTGINGGYTFFAPGVPNSFKIVFEIHYPNGEVEYELPHVTRSATVVRLATLLHYIGLAKEDALREAMVKMLTYPVSEEHPHATTIRTVFGFIDEPTVAEARKGKKESYKVLYAYDFKVGSEQVDKPVQ